MRQAKEREIRARLEREVGGFPEAVWQLLVEDGEVREVLMGGYADGFEALIRRARKYMGLCRTGGSSIEPLRRYTRDVPLNEHERERAVALSEFLAKVAAPLALKFRREVLADKILTVKQMHALLTSPAAQYFSADQFKKRAIPVVGHSATTLKNRMIRVDPPGRRYKVSGNPVTTVTWAGPDGWINRRRACRGSILAELRRVCRRIEARCGWDEFQSIEFALTDRIPQIGPVGATATITDYWGEYGNRRAGKITLTVEPWVSAETVTRVYRDIQTGMLGRNKRQEARRNIAVFRFVTKHSDGDGRHPPWPELLNMWNETNPRDRYSSYRTICRDYGRAKKALLFPNLKEEAVSSLPQQKDSVKRT